MDDFNPAAGAAARWTARQLPASDAAFLAALPLTKKRGPFTLVHGSLRRPTEEYLLDNEAARATLALLRGRYCLVGHSHLPSSAAKTEATRGLNGLPTIRRTD